MLWNNVRKYERKDPRNGHFSIRCLCSAGYTSPFPGIQRDRVQTLKVMFGSVMAVGEPSLQSCLLIKYSMHCSKSLVFAVVSRTLGQVVWQLGLGDCHFDPLPGENECACRFE